MRISGGAAKGRKVESRKAFVGVSELRPTSSKVRQAIFNILGGRIDEAIFLDLYAGSGTVGIEALSRGAARTVFVDENALRINIIGKFLEKFAFSEKSVLLNVKADNFLRRHGWTFDIIFIDPPYLSDEAEKALAIIDESNILKDNGVVIVEHNSKKIIPDNFVSLRLKKVYKYGDTSLSLYRKEMI